MIIIGCDYHPAFEQIALVDTETGDCAERRLEHRETVEKFYRDLAAQEKRFVWGWKQAGMRAGLNDHSPSCKLSCVCLVTTTVVTELSVPRRGKTCSQPSSWNLPLINKIQCWHRVALRASLAIRLRWILRPVTTRSST